MIFPYYVICTVNSYRGDDSYIVGDIYKKVDLFQDGISGAYYKNKNKDRTTHRFCDLIIAESAFHNVALDVNKSYEAACKALGIILRLPYNQRSKHYSRVFKHMAKLRPYLKKNLK